MINFKINNKEVQGDEGLYILQVAEKYGIEIPTLCHHKALEPAGMCRMCTVEIFDGRRTKFVTSCNYPIWEGMEVFTDTKAVHKGRKFIVEMLYAKCPDVPLLKELAEKYGIGKPRFPLGDDDCILCGLCVRMCEKVGNSAISLTGRGLDIKVDIPFHLQSDMCMACGACASVCPTGHISLEKIRKEFTKQNTMIIPSEYEMGLKGRKPIYVPYAQAVPNNPAIDRDVCMHFKTGKCQVCKDVCEMDAIDLTMEDETIELEVGAVILSPGFTPFDPTEFTHYQYAEHPNVMTAMEFERLLSASGPTEGHLVKLSNHKEPQKIAWFQCVGSRDMNRCDNRYCSSVCCMYALKEAVIAKEHAAAGDDLDCAIFYMDMRTHGKDFERSLNTAVDQGVRLVRTRVHSVESVRNSDELLIRYMSEKGEIVKEIFDMIVLSIGLEISPNVVNLANRLGIELTQGNFADTASFTPVSTNRKGFFVCGAFQGPKDIPQSVVDSSAAAGEAGALLSDSRNTLTLKAAKIPEINVIGDRPRIGVFVCKCGSNINGVINVPDVAAYAAGLPYVEYACDNLYTCSQDTQETMTRIIKAKNLNRVVVASCSPKTHEPLFQETLINAGLNKYLFEMTNIRNHVSWVHKDNPKLATQKAKDLVRMSVAKVGLMQPLKEADLTINPVAMVVGGGLSGLAAARNIADQGYKVHIVEKNKRLGGQANHLYKTFKGEDIQQEISSLIQTIISNENINIHLNTTIEKVEGFVGNFKSDLICDKRISTIEHGVAVIATGASPLEPYEYCYGMDKRVITNLELDQKFIKNDDSLKDIETAVFIQCVGSRESDRPYCSRVCCTHSIDNALELKKCNPHMAVYILYRDIRTYGEREYKYQAAREAGVIFIRYSVDDKPVVHVKEGKLFINMIEPVLNRPIEIETDLIALATAIVPNRDERLANFFKVPLNEDGFFVERHAKLGPSEFATDGVFLCGMAHYPKPIDEAIAHGQAAASRAVTLLAKETIHTSGNVANVNPMACSSCGVCIAICPFSAPSFETSGRFEGKAQINSVLCKGCGLCMASCRSGAIHLNGFDFNQIFAQISALNEEHEKNINSALNETI